MFPEKLCHNRHGIFNLAVRFSGSDNPEFRMRSQRIGKAFDPLPSGNRRDMLQQKDIGTRAVCQQMLGTQHTGMVIV